MIQRDQRLRLAHDLEPRSHLQLKAAKGPVDNAIISIHCIHSRKQSSSNTSLYLLALRYITETLWVFLRSYNIIKQILCHNNGY